MSAHDDVVAFAEHVAHDLHNTVTAIAMAVELARDEVSERDGDLSSLLDRVERSTSRLAAQVQGLPTTAAQWPLDAAPLAD